MRCTSSQSEYITILERLLCKFQSRGYPKELLKQIANGINYQQRKELLQPAPKRTLDKDVTIFCAAYSPGLNSSAIRRILTIQWCSGPGLLPSRTSWSGPRLDIQTRQHPPPKLQSPKTQTTWILLLHLYNTLSYLLK